jgi:hypothetical protein
MEEKQENTLYDDYKFLTEEEMERLGLSEYKNSDAVRAHLHGYVIRYDLYKKVISFLFIIYGAAIYLSSSVRVEVNYPPEFSTGRHLYFGQMLVCF